MAKIKYIDFLKTSNRFCQIIVKFRRILIRKIYRLSQNLLANSYRERKAGFVIPTVALLLLVLSLIVGALVSRSLTRATQVIGERQQQVIYNAASPAIDRARAKLEYLFNGDSRLPSGIPPENTLTSMMLNDNTNGISVLPSDPYTLPGETRLDLNGDKVADNAWSYQINAKGKVDAQGKPILDTTIAYSIVWATPNSNNNDPSLNDTSNNTITTRAKLLQVRTGPLSNSLLSQACLTGGQQSALLTGQGWFDSNAFLTKNFQIDAFVLPSDQTNGTVSTLELEQDRQVNKGNTWGGWFRYDLEAYPGARFNWNGALHTEGNLILTTEGNTFTGYLISSPASCLYTQPASQITVGQPIASNNGGVAFQGQIVNGSMKRNALYGNNMIALGPGVNTGPSTFHLFNGQGTQPITTGDPNNPPNVILQSGNQTSSTSTDSIQNTVYPADVALDPVALITKNISQARPILTSGRPNQDQTNVDKQDSNWDNGSFNKYKRIFRQSSAVPYVDDTYRADNRYGPKPTYGQTAQLKLPANTAIGQTISNNDPNYQTLTSNTPTVAKDPASFGLDGYWERRASNEGLRIIVGQRLELGNAFGWGSNNSNPLYPPQTNIAITNEARQRRSQRDNLAAVQSTAIYHYTQNNGSFPTTCLATTVHPGTAQTITNSTSAGTPNFFIGQSTNGVEYAPPKGNESDFANAIDDPNSPLRKTLSNLAYFAGDPNGGAPSYTPVQDSYIHPYPYLAMWGDFSNLRRIIPTLRSASNTGTSYAQLSIADKSYLHTAACTLGILATNINNIQAGATNPQPPNVLKLLATSLSNLPPINNPTPDAYIQQLIINKDPNTQLAQQLMLNEQINRDRTYGFSKTLSCKLPVVLSQLCPTNPKYPSLFYLFPVAVHDYQGKDSKNQIIQDQTTVGENYISDSYNQSIAQIDPTIPAEPKNPLKNLYYQYQILNSSNPVDISSITLTKQSTLPTGAFTEKAFFNGREMLNVRTMDIDLNQLRQNNPPNSNDTWLPTTGTVYAFREDAVREDSIVRPAGSNIPNQGSMCLYTAQCPNQSLLPPTDPKIGDNGITIKTVDYYADPERRPHGFRLINGTDLKRIGIADSNNIHGLSFISDAFVYIKGDFNYHSTDGTANNLIEEFKETLNQSDWSNFYTRKTLNSNFAQPTTDHWRPVEILADGVSIISNNFVDGSIEDGIIGSQTSSYSNQNPIKSNSQNWIRENPYDSKSPIVISQNGNPLYCLNNVLPPPCNSPQDISNQYNDFTTRRTLMNATQTRVNATIIGGIVPSQAGQAYGGLHNFPRFLENWSQQNLYISGSFLQLNFSNTATAPFDQDAWEPPNSADPNIENIPYYGAPNRLWGYDVGLQYAPAGPVSQRFVTPNNTRSEFYQELLANDPYICNLRRAKLITGNSSVPGNQVDPSANATNCPIGSN